MLVVFRGRGQLYCSSPRQREAFANLTESQITFQIAWGTHTRFTRVTAIVNAVVMRVKQIEKCGMLKVDGWVAWHFNCIEFGCSWV